MSNRKILNFLKFKKLLIPFLDPKFGKPFNIKLLKLFKLLKLPGKVLKVEKVEYFE